MDQFKKVLRYVLFFFPYGPLIGFILVFALGERVNSWTARIIIFWVACLIPLYFGVKHKMYAEILVDTRAIIKKIKERKNKNPPT